MEGETVPSPVESVPQRAERVPTDAVSDEAMWTVALTALAAAMEMGVVGWIQAALLLATAFVFYYYLMRPFNWVRDLTDVGFSHVKAGARRTRHQAMEDVRRRRRVGNMPPVYPNGWFVLLESEDLAVGQVKHVAALGENFAVLRTADRKVHVLDAYCPHLGANMAVGGAVRGDCLECPFHGWRFRAEDGRCTAVPYAEKVPEFAKVKRWESMEVNTLIMVWYHAENEPPSWLPEQVPQLETGEWRYRGRSEFLINSHIQEIPENGGDVAHLNAIHAPSLLAGSDLSRTERFLYSFMKHVWEAAWDPHPDQTHRAVMQLHHEIRLCNKLSFVSMNVRAEQIGPGYVEMYLTTSLGYFLVTLTVTPLEPLMQRVLHRIFTPPSLAPLAPLMLIGEAIMFERDVMVWNHKTYEDKPLLVREDRTILRHRRWFNQFYSENSPRYSSVQKSLDW